jgi:XTP/dITP diphosphohydrolase
LSSGTLLIATGNRGKVREIRSLLGDLELVLLSLRDLAPVEPCPEDGDTYEENAVRKALYYSRLVPDPTVADDSGLEVEALGGEPGILSARFAGAGAGSEEKCRQLLARMETVPERDRAARFQCVVALARNGKLLQVFRGTCAGVITTRMRGDRGFGFDPVFFFPPAGRTFAELDPEEKNRVSHRGGAILSLIDYLRAGGNRVWRPAGP